MKQSCSLCMCQYITSETKLFIIHVSVNYKWNKVVHYACVSKLQVKQSCSLCMCQYITSQTKLFIIHVSVNYKWNKVVHYTCVSKLQVKQGCSLYMCQWITSETRLFIIHVSVNYKWNKIVHYTPTPQRGRGYTVLPQSICPSFRPSKIFFVTFFSVTVDGRNLIFGHKHHIGIPYCG